MMRYFLFFLVVLFFYPNTHAMHQSPQLSANQASDKESKIQEIRLSFQRQRSAYLAELEKLQDKNVDYDELKNPSVLSP